ncbi:MAG: hypothetical protein QNJ94_09845 [Alphaproteobacteria bacterium]|nr:hypothetical protein [Alphaproteobacteria bacterium]
MTIAATFLGGAKSRLLPASVPFRFFGAAVLFHPAAWAVLAWDAEAAVGFTGGLGLPLAALHLLTLGVLAGTAIGAALQMLPVATRQPLGAVWPARLAFWLFLPGVFAVGHGMGALHLWVLVPGGLAVSAALALFGWLMVDNLRGAKSLPIIAAHGWLAMVALAALAVLGLLLVFDFQSGLLQDHTAAARAHLILASYGFMGMLVMGFSQILVPMFGLSPEPPVLWGRAALLLSALALAVATVGAVANDVVLMLAGAAIGLAAAGAHLWTMAAVMRARMRKHLGLSFLLIRAGWVLFPLSILLGALDLLDLLGPRGGTLFGFVLLFGWLLTFLLGILQRVLPFLASMHAAKAGGKAPLVSALTAAMPLKVHAICHAGALVLVAAGIVAESPVILRLGAVAGLVGALAFAAFAAEVVRRMTGWSLGRTQK